jgi:hypothetical protein
MAKSKTKATSKKKVRIPARDPQKRTRSGIFDNLRKLPHPVEEILGLDIPAVSRTRHAETKVSEIVQENHLHNAGNELSTLEATGDGMEFSASNDISMPENHSESPQAAAAERPVTVVLQTTVVPETMVQQATMDQQAIVPQATVAQQTIFPEATVAERTIVPRTTVVSGESQLWSSNSVASGTTVVPQTIVISPDRYTAVPNDVLDKLLPTLDVYEQILLLRLFRLSRGFHSETCCIGYQRLAESCNISKKQVQRSVERLENLGLVERKGIVQGGPNRKERGNIYQINIPGATIVHQTTVTERTTVAEQTTVVSETPIKRKELKEKNTHTQTQPVGVGGSRFRLEECRRYADHLHKTGQGIKNPGGYALAIFRSGESDQFIEAYLHPAPKLDFSKCPDCRGTGYRILERNGESVATKCLHERLYSPGRDFSSCPDCEGTGALLTEGRRLAVCRHELLDKSSKEH